MEANDNNNNQELEEFQKSIPNTKVYIWGSAECDQFDTGNPDVYDSRRPVPVPFFAKNKIHIHHLACGAQHSLALSTKGEAYSWGCKDDGVLGRTDGSKIPGKVELPCPVDLISCGDSHSAAAHSLTGTVFTWGVYRSALKGKMSEASLIPQRVGEIEFRKRTIQKMVSGTNHTMVLSQEKVYVWGDPDTKVLGRMPVKRRRFKQSLKPGGLRFKRVQNIYTGGNHCFVITTKRNKKLGRDQAELHAWGLNNWGQLGVGKTENTFRAHEVTHMRDKPIKSIVGGDYHTLFLLEDGSVLGCGRNDDHQLGPIDKAHFDELHADVELEEGQSNKYESALYPTKLNFEGAALREVLANGNFSYGIQEDLAVRSWGLGFSYVLGNGRENEVETPYTINPRFLKSETIGQFSLGGNHVAFVCAEEAYQMPALNEGVIVAPEKSRRGRKKGVKNSNNKKNKKRRGRATKLGRTKKRSSGKSLRDQDSTKKNLKRGLKDLPPADDKEKALATKTTKRTKANGKDDKLSTQKD